MSNLNVSKWIAAVALVFTATHASANNFQYATNKSGCDSIVLEDSRRACEDVQRKKNDACNVKMTCELRDQENDIKDYNEAKEKLKTINDSDRSRLEDTIRDYKKKLDARKAQAPEGIKIANACIARRNDVQDWFANVAIPVTRKAGDEALAIRKALLEKLKQAEERRKAAADKRAADASDANNRELTEATEAFRNVEKELEQFNNKYGDDVARNVDRLIQKYVDGKSEHDEPSAQAQNRLEKCQKLDALSY